MPTNMKIAIRLEADSTALVGGVRVARDELGRLDATAGATGRALHGVGEGQQSATMAMVTAARAAAVLGLAMAAQKIIQYADAWSLASSKIGLYTTSAAQAAEVQEKLFQVSQRTRSDFASSVDLYGSLADAMLGMGKSQEDVLRVSETITKTFKISGTEAGAAAGAITQLAQALGSGTLRGDEFNSVMEASPRLAKALAAGLGVPRGELRALAEQGKLTAEQVVAALQAQSAAVDAEFGQLAATVGDAWVQLGNAAQKYIGETDRATGATRTLAAGMSYLAQHFDNAVTGVGGLAVALAGLAAGRKLGPLIAETARVAEASANAAGQAAVLRAETARAAEAAAVAAGKRAADVAATLAQVGALGQQAARQREAASAQMDMARGIQEATGRTQPYAKALHERNEATRTLIAYQRLERQLTAEAAVASAAKAAADAAAAQAQAAVAAGMTRTTFAARAAAAAQTAWNTAMAFVGGPIGVAILGTAGAIYYLATRTTEAQKAQEAFNRVVGDGRKRIEEMNGASRERAAQLVAEQREAVEAAEREVAATRARVQALRDELAAKQEASRSFGALPWTTEGSEDAIKQTQRELAEAERRAQAASAALEGMRSVGQKTGDAVGLELAGKVMTGSSAFRGLGTAMGDVLKQFGLTIQSGRLMTEEQAQAEKAIATLNQALNAGAGFLRSYGTNAEQVGGIIAALKEKIDPVAAAIAGMNREIGAARAAEGAERSALAALQQVNQEREKLGQKPLTTVSPEYLQLLTKAKEAETARVQAQVDARGKVIDLEKRIAQAQAAGNSKLAAKLEKEKAVTEMVARGVDAKVAAAKAEQDYGVAVAGASAQAGEALQSRSRATRQALELAAATRQGGAAVAEATTRHEIENETVKAGAGERSALAARIREEAAARRELAAAQWDRDMDMQIAAAKALAEAEALGADAVERATIANQAAAEIEKEGVAADSERAKTIREKTAELSRWQKQQAAEREVRSAKEELKYAQQELALMGEAEPVRARALESLRIRREAAERFGEANSESLRSEKAEWIALQEQIADVGALKTFDAKVDETSAGIADDLAAKMFEKGGSILDWWRNLLSRMAIEIASKQFIMPVVQTVVGAVPSLFGIQAPVTGAAAAGGQAAMAGGANSLLGTASNWGMSKAGSWALDKVFPGGFTNSLDLWGANTLGIGTVTSLMPSASVQASQIAMLQAANPGIPAAELAAAYQAPTAGTAVTGGLSAYLGAAGIGAAGGGLLGGWLGTNANSKAVGGLAGAAGGLAATGAYAGIMGMSAIGGPVGLAIGAVVGAIMGMLGTVKKSVGPMGGSSVKLSSDGFAIDRTEVDNGGSMDAARQIGEGAVSILNTIVKGVGGSYKVDGKHEFGNLTFWQKDGKYKSNVGSIEKEFGSMEEAIADFAKRSVEMLSQMGQVTGLSDNVLKALKNTKAKDPQKLAEDLAFADAFDTAVATMTDSLKLEDEARKQGVESAKALTTQIQDFKTKAKDLGLDTAAAASATRTMIDALVAGTQPATYTATEAAVVSLKAHWEEMVPVLVEVGYTAEQAAKKAAEGYRNNLKVLQDGASGNLDANLRATKGEQGYDQGVGLADAYTSSMKDIKALWTDAGERATQGAKAAGILTNSLTGLAQAGTLSNTALLALQETYKDTPAVVTAAKAALSALVDSAKETALAGIFTASGREVPSWLQAKNAGLDWGSTAYTTAVSALEDTGLTADGAFRHLMTLSKGLEDGTVTSADFTAAMGLVNAALQKATEAAKSNAASLAGLYTAAGEDAPAAVRLKAAGLAAGSDAYTAAEGALNTPSLTLAGATAIYNDLKAKLDAGTLSAADFSAAMGVVTGALQDSTQAAEKAKQVDTALAQRANTLLTGQIDYGPAKVRAEYEYKIRSELEAAEAAGYSAEQMDKLSAVLAGEFSAALKAAYKALDDTIAGIRGSVNTALLAGRDMTADELFATTGFDPANSAAAAITALFAAIDAGQQPAETLKAIFADLSAQYRSGALAADTYQSVMQAVVSRYQQGAQAIEQVKTSVADYVAGLRTSIKQYLDGMAVGDKSQLSAAEKLARAQSDFDEQLRLARGGEGVTLQQQRAALDGITSYADRLLEVGLAWNASGTDQRTLQDWVTAQLQGLPDQVSESELVRLEIAKLNTDSGARVELLKADVSGKLGEVKDVLGLMKADLNGDLKITWDEFSAWSLANSAELTAIKTALGLSNASLKDIFTELDLNGDGVISKVEAARAGIVAAVAANPSSIASSLQPYFATLDTSVNGTLDFTEFKAGLTGIATDAELKRIFSEIDANGNGEITQLEIVKNAIVTSVNSMASANPGSIASALYPYFSMLNTTAGDGLTYAEFSAGLSGAGLATNANMTSWFQVLDSNGDGQLSRLELMNAAANSTNTKLDTNNASVVSLKNVMDAVNNSAAQQVTHALNTINAVNNAATAAGANALNIINAINNLGTYKLDPGFTNVVNAINHLPHASGGPASGLTMVNDAGPEFIRLPGGSHVVTAAASVDMARRLAAELAPTPTMAAPNVVAFPVPMAPTIRPSAGTADPAVVARLDALIGAVATLANRLPKTDQGVVDAVEGVVEAVRKVEKTLQAARPPALKRAGAR